MSILALHEALTQHSYTFYIIDPTTGEFTKYYSGSIIEILGKIQNDPENSMIADVLKKHTFGQAGGENGIISIPYDGHLYAFIPNAH